MDAAMRYGAKPSFVLLGPACSAGSTVAGGGFLYAAVTGWGTRGCHATLQFRLKRKEVVAGMILIRVIQRYDKYSLHVHASSSGACRLHGRLLILDGLERRTQCASNFKQFARKQETLMTEACSSAAVFLINKNNNSHRQHQHQCIGSSDFYYDFGQHVCSYFFFRHVIGSALEVSFSRRIRILENCYSTGSPSNGRLDEST
jgi:hypothetical protein